MDDIVVRFRAIVANWDLDRLRSEVAAALSDVDPSSRAYVPDQLIRALDMFIDSYGESAGPRVEEGASPRA